MDNGIWATWYNLDQKKQEDHIEWLHNRYLPKIITHDGIAWAAHYEVDELDYKDRSCLLYTSPSPRDRQKSRMPSSA